MVASSVEQKMYYTLRLAVSMCFIGHGAFGIIAKPIWCNYFGVFGIGNDLAYQLMPLVGIIDILMGISILIYPIRATVTWLVIWGFATALLRPLSGEPFAEFIERAGNFGAPLALLLLTGGIKNLRSLHTPPIYGNIQPDALTLRQTTMCLRIVVFLLLAGHGWLNIIEKKSLLDQYAALGFSDPAGTARTAGIFELIAAFSVLIRPFGPLLLVIFAWKMTSELFYPNYPLLEWVERGGSYGAILALWFATNATPSFLKHKPAKRGDMPNPSKQHHQYSFK